MKHVRSGFVSGLVVSAGLLVGSVTAAQDPATARPVTTERVVHLPAAQVGGTHHRATPVILPPPANVYERATRRDRARDTGAPSARQIRRDL